jgi:hypothetical protein
VPNNETYPVTIRRGDAPSFAARIRNNSGAYITQATVSTITYTIYTLTRSEPSARTAVTAHTTVSCTVASVVFDTLQTGTPWGSKDTTGYNFLHQPNVLNTVFANLGADQYLVEYTITPTTGRLIQIGFLISVAV